MLIPLARVAISLLRTKDENSTGWDDAAANQLDTAITTIEAYLNAPEQPTMPT